jgi:hypothetical protein
MKASPFPHHPRAHTRSAGVVVVLFAVLALAAAPAPAALEYLDNGVVRVGVDMVRGGAIGYLSLSGTSDNVVNTRDLGRYIQQSYYAGPFPYIPAGALQHPAYAGWGWNPVQAGDVYGYQGLVTASSNDGTTLYVQARPKQWALRNVNADGLVEQWLTLDANRIHVHCRLTNARADSTRYPARHQELPAVYTIGRLWRLFSYTGSAPFTGGAVAQITNSGPPWAYWSATENWSALVDANGWGLGVVHAGATLTVGGFHGTPGTGGPFDDATGYIAPLQTDVLDQAIVYDYDYTLILGNLDADIRAWAVARAPAPVPNFVFTTGRAHCTTGNLTDGRAPFSGFWPLSLDAADPQVLLPPSLWQAADAPCVLVTGAWRTQGATAEMFFAGADGVFSGTKRVEFPVIPDGQVRSYRVDLTAHPLYTGPVSRLRFDPIIAQSPGDAVDLYAITTASPAAAPGVPSADRLAIIATAAPNPFNPGTTISFDATRAGHARVEVFDLRGMPVRTLLDAILPAGPAALAWDGRDDSGRPVASGAYLARVRVGEQSGRVRLMLVK